MPLLRKLIKVGNSRAVIIPSDWLKLHEKEMGEKVQAILMEVDNVITLAPRRENNDTRRRTQGKATKRG